MYIDTRRTYKYVSDLKSEKVKTQETKEKDTDKKNWANQMGIVVQQMREEEDKTKVMLTCLEISRRISGGDNVPPADHQYLMKHDLDLYARSISMRFPKNNPYKYEQISSDEDKSSFKGNLFDIEL